MGIDNLLGEMVMLTAEMKELKGQPEPRREGQIIEARLDKNRGPIATLLVQNGTLRGRPIVAGTASAALRVMVNDKGHAPSPMQRPSTRSRSPVLLKVPSRRRVQRRFRRAYGRQLVEQRRQKIKDDAIKACQQDHAREPVPRCGEGR